MVFASWHHIFCLRFFGIVFENSGVWRSSGVGSFDILGGAECLLDTCLGGIELFVAAWMCLAHTSRTGGTGF